MVSLLFEKDGGFSSINFLLGDLFLLLSVSVSILLSLFYFKPCQLVYVPLFSNCVSLYFAFFVLFQVVSVVSVSLSTSLVLKEDLSTRWKKLSLSESEENQVALRMNRKKRDFILVGKFLTHRSLNIEVVAKHSNLYGAQKEDSMSQWVVKTFCCLLLN